MAKVLHASASGYFPSCLIEDASLATQSLADAMEIYWKVKSWTITITSAEFPISPRTFTQTATDETYLVCDNSGASGNGFSPNDLDNFFFLDGFYVNSYASPTLYGVVPSFLIRGDTGEYNSIGGDAFDVLVGTFSFFGQNYPLYRPSDEGDDRPASGVIEPTSYWTYEA
jgi:hypothetical protein